MDNLAGQNLEEYIIARCLYKDDQAIIFSQIKSEWFSNTMLGNIYKTLNNIYTSGSNLDIITVEERLKDKKKYFDTIHKCYFENPYCFLSISEEYIKVFKLKYSKRKAGELFKNNISSLVDGEDYQKIIYNTTEQLMDLTADETEIKTLKSSIDKTIRSMKVSETSSIKTYYKKIDDVIRGFGNGQLVIIAGKTGVGKSAFVTNIIHNNCVKRNYKCALVSTEMLAEEVFERLIMIDNKFTFREVVENKELNLEALKNNENIIVFDKLFSLGTLCANMKLVKKKYNVDFIVVDYIQQIESKGESRVVEIESVARGLKKLAQVLEIPIIALSQFSREAKYTKTPSIYQLKGSGELENGANKVILLYREDENSDIITVEMAKSRNTESNKIVYLRFDKSILTFADTNKTINKKEDKNG